MFTKEAALLQQIAQSRESIRQKHQQLKHGLQDVQTNVAKVLKPVIDPLNTIENKGIEKNAKKKVFYSTPHKKSLNSQLYNDDGSFEISEESDSNACETIPSNKDNLNNNNNGIYDQNFTSDNITKTYLQEFENQGLNIDTAFGVRTAYGKKMIGNQEIKFKDGEIVVGDTVYPETSGLLELLFNKKVNEKKKLMTLT